MFAKKIGTIHRQLYASPEYIRRKGNLKKPNESLEHDFIVQSKEMSRIDRSSWELMKGREKVLLEAKAVMTCNSLRVMRNSAVSGVGIALLPAQIFNDDLECGRLKEVLPGWKTSPLNIHVVYSSKKFMSSRVRAFLKSLETSSLSETIETLYLVVSDLRGSA